MTTRNLRERICHDLYLSDRQLNRLILRAPHTYKTYTIAKKSGGRRVISQPAKETKYIQSWLMNNVFNILPVHQCATAYKKGASIKINARIHSSHSFFVKLDFSDFFPSIKIGDVVMHLQSHLNTEFSLTEIMEIARICCIQYKSGDQLCLSVGAPTSPLISNSVMYCFDEKVSQWCELNKLIYTRYADDLTFSTNVKNISSEVLKKIDDVVKEIAYPELLLNKKKTIHLSKKYQRRITGLIITNESKVSLGRTRKREIRSMIHRFVQEKLDEKSTQALQGLLSFALDVEREFFERMEKKYGAAALREIMKTGKNH